MCQTLPVSKKMGEAYDRETQGLKERDAHFVKLKYVINGVDASSLGVCRRMSLTTLRMSLLQYCWHDCCVGARMRRQVSRSC